MYPNPRPFILLTVLCIGKGLVCPLFASGDRTLDVQKLPGVGPISSHTLTMSNDDLETYFEKLKKGTAIEMTLDQGKVVDGVFSSYDDYYGMVWLVSRGGDTMMNQKGFRIAGIRHVTRWNKEKPITLEQMGTSDYFLIKELEK